MNVVKLTLIALSVAFTSWAQAASSSTISVPSGALEVSVIDHVGMNVPDVDAAIHFFADLAGAKVISDIRPGAIPAEWKTQFRWHPSSELQRFAMVQLDGGAKVELFQYRGPDINPEHPHEDDSGASHFALKTNDIARSLALVKSKGLKVLNEPITNPDGVQWFYFLTPWGSQMELVSMTTK
ncbi:MULTISPECIES: VOC family protein [Pseudomonas]|uniref:Glyoxalase n=1 Tax=Pseudomonas entomophila TaxID=312306 RepID=A0A3S8UMQ3_9PSED|nr:MULTISPECIES: VOC family protein [Pseudomonas]AZL69561.1 glyoxalase [Pseudomonas oryziphila]UVL87621.1 VOC family protein [Pseudomonas sichuanensis]